MEKNRPTYYDVLGLSQNASPEEIKKRYRELARRYHPDVAGTPDATAKFKEINEAHRVLSDLQKRAAYDAELKLARMRTAAGEKGRKGEGEKARPTPTDRRPPKPEGPTPNAQRPTPDTRHPIPSPAEQLAAEAAAAFRRMRFREAEAFCRQALRSDRRNAAAYEILGDIHRVRGRTDEAIAMYSYVLQLDRNNRSVQAKFDRLVGRPSGPTMTGHAARTSRHATPRRTQPAEARRQTPSRALLNSVGIGLIAFLLLIVGISRDPPAPSPIILDWDPLAIFALAASGALGGLLLAVNHQVLSAREELASRIAGRNQRLFMPLGALLLILGLLFFYAAFLIYILIGFVQATVSRSILYAFAASFAIVALFALVSHASAQFILLCGGNIVFVALIAGWAIGDIFRQ